MALNKRKVLETARKHAQKGAKAKALKEYNKLLKADPRDAKLLLEVGDAYRRWGQAEEAIAQYGKVAQQYRQDGFDARAVAVFKQILNLDPKHYAAYVSLSELYQRMGLDAEAITALQTAADGYHKEGRKAEALDLLRQTAALDPTNTTSRLKVAELLRQEGMQAEALSEYQAVADELEKHGDREQVLIVLERILEFNSDDIDTLTSLVKRLMSSGDFERAETFAIRALNVSAEPVQYESLMDLYTQSGDQAKLADATRGLAKLHRDRGDEEAARDLMQRLPVDDLGSSSRLAVDVSEVAEPDLADDDLLEEEPFLTLDEDEVGDNAASLDDTDELDLGGDEIELEVETDTSQPGDPVDPAALPEGDPDQLLAEANVYLRYGKRDQAIASLRGVLAQDPVHRAALEKLGEAYASDGQNGPAVEAWKEAAVQVREAGDADAFAVLRDRIAALDPASAEQMGSIEPKAAAVDEAASEVGIELDLDVEVDLNLETAIGEVADSATQSGLSLSEEDDRSVEGTAEAADDDEFEIELDDDAFDDDDDADADVGEDESETASASESFSVDSQTAPDLIDGTGDEGLDAEALTNEIENLDDESIDFDFDVDEMTSPETDSGTGQSTTTAAKIGEELEEAEFYLAQDMLAEAEEILSRVLELVPNHPSALLRMGELEAARGQAPDLAVAEASSDGPSMDAAEMTFGGVTDGVTEDLANVDSFAGTEEIVEEAVDIADPVEEDESMTANATTEPVAAEDASTTATERVEAEATETEAAETDDGESFDLREALADVLSDDEELSDDDASSGVLSTVEDGFGSIFSDFKKGVTATLEEGDFETRYDLGIAYREMGLFEDAIGEFRVCLDSSARRFDSLYLMGICARDLSRFGDAVNHFEQALALPEIPEERLAGVYFELGIAQQGAGEIERALASLRRTLELDGSFPAAAERLAELEADGESSPKLAQPGEEFESFDDLFESDDDEEGDDAMIAAVPVETFESFEDVMAEAESIPDAVEEAEAPSVSDDDTQSTKKSGRKKISFV